MCSCHTSRTQDHRTLTAPTVVTTSGDYPSWELVHRYTRRTTQGGDHGIHVGLDAWNPTPVSINNIAQILNEPNQFSPLEDFREMQLSLRAVDEAVHNRHQDGWLRCR
jgi:hypothetical protein